MTERKNEISGNSEMEKECKTYEKGNRKPTREEFHEYSQVSARCSTRLLEKKEWVNKIVVASELGINQLNVYVNHKKDFLTVYRTVNLIVFRIGHYYIHLCFINVIIEVFDNLYTIT